MKQRDAETFTRDGGFAPIGYENKTNGYENKTFFFTSSLRKLCFREKKERESRFLYCFLTDFTKFFL